jgi:ParB family chromosome partitioning protein
MSDRLAQRLSAHRTAALQIEVARHPQVALAALVHGMVQTVLQGSHYGHDLPLGVSLKVQDRLEGMAPDWPESPAAVALRELQQVAGEALPEDSAELFAALLAKSQDELVRLLAVCVASTVDVVTPAPRRTSPARNWRRPWAWTWPHGGSRPQKATSSMCRRPRFWKPWASSRRITSPGWRS